MVNGTQAARTRVLRFAFYDPLRCERYAAQSFLEHIQTNVHTVEKSFMILRCENYPRHPNQPLLLLTDVLGIILGGCTNFALLFWEEFYGFVQLRRSD